VTVLTFSSWDIEFARFARMYAPFQFVAVCFFWSLYRHSQSPEARGRYLAVAVALAGVLTHELGVFLALLLFLPMGAWLEGGWRNALAKQAVYLAASLAVLGLGLLQATFDFRSLGVPEPLPVGFTETGNRIGRLAFGASLLGSPGLFLAGALAVVGLSVAHWRDAFEGAGAVNGERFVLTGFLVLAGCSVMLHQFALGGLLLGLLAWRRPSLLLQRNVRHALLIMSVIALLWAAAFVANHGGIQAVGQGDVLRAARLTFFGFPELYMPVFRPWADVIPLLGGFLGLAVVWQILKIRDWPPAAMVGSPVLALVLVVIALGIRPPLVTATRYSLFLYPLALCVGFMAMARLGELLERRSRLKKLPANGIALAGALLAFALTEDFNPRHLLNQDREAISYRLGPYERFARHWYPRSDFARPANFVDGAASDGSRIIVSHKANTVSAYLNSDFAVFWPWNDFGFSGISRERGTRELWSGRRLLSTVEDIGEHTKGAETVWLIILGRRDSLTADIDLLWPGRVTSVQTHRPGRDQRIEVWQVELRRESER
jgi:hypothetical protein